MGETHEENVGGERCFALIIGAGFGGIGMAIQLRTAGITDFLIVEKAEAVGGVWEANTYPGAACDVPSHLYSFSFEPWDGWSRRYGPQSEIRTYLQHCAERHDLGPKLRLGRSVESAAWDDSEKRWRVALDDGSHVLARVLIPAVGQLSRPAQPAIPGLGEFSGPVFHSATWDHDVALAGKRVGVIGTGASAIQFVPEIARDAGSLTLFQRTPPYVFPKFDRAYGRFERWLYRRVPGARRFTRWLQYLSHEARGYILLRFRPPVKLYEWRYRFMLWRRFRDPAERRALQPDHPLGCKRILFSNHWLDALARPNVSVVSERIEHIEQSGVRTADGARHEFDVLILGTGFKATEFLTHIDGIGREGRRLSEAWKDAYLGMTVPGFPNLFLLYGPNTNLGHNSIIFMLERQYGYLLQAIERLRAEPGLALEVDAPTSARYNEIVQHALARSIWAHGCDNWYKDAAGRIVNNWPDLTVTYARRVKRFDEEHYHGV